MSVHSDTLDQTRKGCIRPLTPDEKQKARNRILRNILVTNGLLIAVIIVSIGDYNGLWPLSKGWRLLVALAMLLSLVVIIITSVRLLLVGRNWLERLGGVFNFIPVILLVVIGFAINQLDAMSFAFLCTLLGLVFSVLLILYLINTSRPETPPPPPDPELTRRVTEWEEIKQVTRDR